MSGAWGARLFPWMALGLLAGLINGSSAGAADERIAIHAALRGSPWVSLSDGVDLPATAARAVAARQPLGLAAADFDGDGVLDLVAAYATVGGGAVDLHRGNADAIYPNAPEALWRKRFGLFTDSPFLDPPRTYATPSPPQLLAAGDFDADGNADVITAALGETALWFIPGDGRGGLGAPRRIELAGGATALVEGEVGRRDGHPDLVVGVDAGAGPALLIYRARPAALDAAPDSIALAAPASSLALGQLDGEPGLDVAAACGRAVVVVHGHEAGAMSTEPRLTSVELDDEVDAVEVGDFVGDARQEIAVLDRGGALHLLRPESGRSLAVSTTSLAVADRRDNGSPPRRLLRGRVSSLAKDDLVVLEPRAARLQVLHRLHLRSLALGGDDLPANVLAAGGEASPEPIAFDVEDGVVAALPLRLSPHAIQGLVVLEEGAHPLAVSIPVPARRFVVDLDDDRPDKDLNDGACLAEGFLLDYCTLRAAIEQANVLPGATQIDFAVGKVHLSTNVPYAMVPLTIDGTAGPDGMVEVDGSADATGLDIRGGNSLLRGLAVYGALESDRPEGNCGISLSELGGSVVEGCHLGTNRGGSSAIANFCGLSIDDSSDNVIGQYFGSAHNLISGNGYGGVEILNVALRNRVEGNFIGTDASGLAALPNGVYGVLIATTSAGGIPSDNVVEGNVVSAASRLDVAVPTGMGIAIQGARENLIRENIVGAAKDAVGSLPNASYGVAVIESPDNVVEENVIAHNGGDGVLVLSAASTGNRISRNSISANDGIGINLSPGRPDQIPADEVSPNDAGDADTGGNRMQNFPVLSLSSDRRELHGSLDSAPDTAFRIEFFASAACDPSGYGEGETYVDKLDVTTDHAGHVDFVAPFTPPAEGVVTATATDPAGNTSEFSACAKVTDLQLLPRLIIGRGLCEDQPRQIELIETQTQADISGDADVTYDWVRDPLETTILNQVLKQVTSYLDSKREDEAGAEKLDIHVARLDVVKQGKKAFVQFQSGDDGIGINVLRAKRGSVTSNFAVVISGIRLVTAKSLEIEGVSVANTVADTIASVFGSNVSDALLILFSGGTSWNGTLADLTNLIGTTGEARMKSLKFDLYGGLIKDLDLMAGVEIATGLIPTKAGPLGLLGGLLARKGAPVIVSQMLDYEVSRVAKDFDEKTGTGKTEDDYITVTDQFGLLFPFLKGFVSAKQPGLSAVQATMDLDSWCMGKATDGLLVWVTPELYRVQVRNENSRHEDPLDLYVGQERPLHAVARFNLIRGTSAGVDIPFDPLGLGDQTEQVKEIVSDFLPGAEEVIASIGIPDTRQYPSDATLSTAGFYEDGDFFARLTYQWKPVPAVITINELIAQVPLPNLPKVATWEMTFPPQPVAEVGVNSGLLRGLRPGNGQVRFEAWIPFLVGLGSDPITFNGVRVLGGTPPPVTVTFTPTRSGPSPTPTSTVRVTGSPTFTLTLTRTPTWSATVTRTATRTATATRTRTPTPTPVLPAVSRIIPDYARQGSAGLELKIEGVNFKPGAAVSFAPSAGITVIPPPPPDFGYVGPTELRQSIDVDTDADIGVRELYVTNPDGHSGGIRPYNEFAVTIADPGPCAGDCNRDDEVGDAEMAMGLQLQFDRGKMAMCPQFDRDSNGRINAAEILAAIRDRGRGCAGSGTPTATPLATRTPTPAGVSACCSSHDEPSCEIDVCAACVCEFEPYCCFVDWASFCVEMAVFVCGDVCPCTTVEPTPTPASDSNCCVEHESAECDQPSCSSCVCSVDPVCCELSWDVYCVAESNFECGDACGCR